MFDIFIFVLFVAASTGFQSLLGSTERIVQEIDSVEYGLTDIQEYYANTGMSLSCCSTVCMGYVTT